MVIPTCGGGKSIFSFGNVNFQAASRTFVWYQEGEVRNSEELSELEDVEEVII